MISTSKRRAAVHAALGDPVRLAIVDELAVSDRSPVELRRLLGIESNLLAHHLDVLEGVGLIERSRSSGDGRRRYVHLLRDALDGLGPGRPVASGRRCSSARRTRPAASSPLRCGGTSPGSPADLGRHPPGRAGASGARSPQRTGPGSTSPAPTPRALATGDALPPLVVTVCDRAHEELDPGDGLVALVDP